MDKKQPVRWKLNLFDLLVMAVVVIAAAAVVLLRWQQQRQAALDDQAAQAAGRITVRYTVELTGMIPQAAGMVKPGDELTERTRKEGMGAVESVEVVPTTTLSKDLTTGDYFLAEIPGEYTAVIVITAQATESDSKIVTDGGMEVRAGTSVRVYGPGYYGSGYIISVERG